MDYSIMQDMSTISGINSPLSKYYVEIMNYEQDSGYYIDLDSEDKHADSIISTDHAKKIYSKKGHDGESSGGVGGKQGSAVKIKILQQEVQVRLAGILQEYKQNKESLDKRIKDCDGKQWVVGSPFSPLEFFEKTSEVKAKEDQIRQKLREKQESHLKIVVKGFEERQHRSIEEKRESIQKAWRTKMFDLNSRLQQAEWKKNTQKSEKDENLKMFYVQIYKEALAKEKVLLEIEIDEHFSNQFKEKLDNIKEGKNGTSGETGVEELREQIEADQIFIHNQETKKWENEKNTLVRKWEYEIREDENSKLAVIEAEIRKQAREEISEIFFEAEAEITKSLDLEIYSLQLSRDGNLKNQQEKWRKEVLEQFEIGQVTESIILHKESIKDSISKELIKSISVHIEEKVLQQQQEKLYRQISEELSQTHEYYRKEIENVYKTQQGEIQHNFEGNLTQRIALESQKKISKKEKELHLRFAQKLEHLKTDRKKDLEDQYTSELKVNPP